MNLGEILDVKLKVDIWLFLLICRVDKGHKVCIDKSF